MALTIKNLGKGTLGTGSPNTVIVATVDTGTSVLVDNVIFVNKSGTNRTITLYVVDNTYGLGTYLKTFTINANTRWVMEPITLGVGDKLEGIASAASAIDFLASGVVKDL